ncbi:putative dehydrogenase [Psychromicrobium silvestre]|uniref:Putative dehydrogenase n=1 Tax=Psychromicrobium silvestre TaxID=1645614 RepID=A0A7Y9LUE3_9MICC|nr:Gfo/Idh/MocA family oxidoreductase [Psychromicrobium silvestre]NYE95761.1 putative dehydrogenase [Psychromicrobium silvestre]
MTEIGSDKPIRTAVIGLGLAGSVFHAPAIAADPAYQLSAIVTADPGRRAKALAAYPGTAVLDSFQQLPFGELDLVVLGTPPLSHAPLAREAIDRGLSVVVDKPFAPSSAEGLELIEYARRAGKLLTVYQNRRWDGEFLTLQRLLEQNTLGEVYRFESRMERWAPTISKDWKTQAQPGVGILFDLGTHLIDQALLLFGPVDQVYGELDARRRQEPSDDDVFLALRHSSGVRSHLSMNVSVAQFAPRLRVLGSEAGYLKELGDLQEAQILAGVLPGQPGYGVDPEANWGRLGREGNNRLVPTERGDFPSFYRLLAESLNDGTPPPVDPVDAVAALRIIEEVRAQNGL